jgi:mannose-6-phosphate isomerase-like protein (cupin superfamily)
MIKILSLFSLLLLPLSAAAPDATTPAGFELWTPAALAGAGKLLATKAATDAHRAAVQQLSSFPNEYFLFVHREADGVVEWHETEADILVVQSGSATLAVGGTQLNGETTEPHEKRGGTIEGGIRQKLSPGDIVRISARTPHQLLVEAGQQFTYFVIKVKGY